MKKLRAEKNCLTCPAFIAGTCYEKECPVRKSIQAHVKGGLKR